MVALVIASTGCRRKYFASPELIAPSNLTATAVSYNQINLSWQDNSTDEDYFRVLCPTMWGIQHQTIATLPSNTISYEHCNLQPMREYEYYVCVHRGEEHTCSGRVYATTPCPVEILYSEFHRYTNRKVYITGRLQSYAGEPCGAEVTAHFYSQYMGELVGTVAGVFNIEAYGIKDFRIDWTEPQDVMPGTVWDDYGAFLNFLHLYNMRRFIFCYSLNFN